MLADSQAANDAVAGQEAASSAAPAEALPETPEQTQRQAEYQSEQLAQQLADWKRRAERARSDEREQLLEELATLDDAGQPAEALFDQSRSMQQDTEEFAAALNESQAGQENLHQALAELERVQQHVAQATALDLKQRAATASTARTRF